MSSRLIGPHAGQTARSGTILYESAWRISFQISFQRFQVIHDAKGTCLAYCLTLFVMKDDGEGGGRLDSVRSERVQRF